MTSDSATERVELLTSESVTERGTIRVTWRVQRADGWLGAAEYPGAELERLDAGPGTIWETRIALTLQRGTLIERIESRPAPYPKRDAIDYLSREPRPPARRVKRSLYRVGRRGQLVAEG